MAEVTVVLVDDHPVVHDGVRAWLEQDPEHRVELVAAGDDVEVAWTGPGRTADVVLLDLNLHGTMAVPEVSRFAEAGRRVVVHQDDRPLRHRASTHRRSSSSRTLTVTCALVVVPGSGGAGPRPSTSTLTATSSVRPSTVTLARRSAPANASSGASVSARRTSRSSAGSRPVSCRSTTTPRWSAM